MMSQTQSQTQSKILRKSQNPTHKFTFSLFIKSQNKFPAPSFQFDFEHVKNNRKCVHHHSFFGAKIRHCWCHFWKKNSQHTFHNYDARRKLCGRLRNNVFLPQKVRFSMWRLYFSLYAMIKISTPRHLKRKNLTHLLWFKKKTLNFFLAANFFEFRQRRF